MTGRFVAPALLAAAALAWPSWRARAGGRLQALRTAPPDRAPGPAAAETWAQSRRRWMLAVMAGLASGLLLGGVLGTISAGIVTVLAERGLRAGGIAPDTVAAGARTRHLPVACDLLGVCLAAGVPVSGALAAVGSAVAEPLGGALRGVARLYRLGADPRTAWADAPPDLAALGRVLVRAGESGSTVVPALQSLAADARAAARTRTEAAVRRAGIWVLAPLGACFLPAFVCLGVVPLVLGIAGDVFS